jgi:hypothetical protein
MLASTAASVVGVARARGEFRLNESAVSGNGTVLEGATLETSAARSEVDLTGGERLQMDAASRGRLYRDRVVLERGVVLVARSTGFGVEAANLRITPASASTLVQVSMRDARSLRVAADGGAADVRNGSGILVARVLPGSALNLSAAQSATTTQLTGVLRKAGNAYLLEDSTTRVTVELRGAGLDKAVGSRIEISGSAVAGQTPAAGAAVGGLYAGGVVGGDDERNISR